MGFLSVPEAQIATTSISDGRYNPPRPMPLVAGIRLGPYEIQSPIGAGGMGDVYRARHAAPDYS